ncbi:MAG: DUF3592 domain-containing protein [Candidatus Acidiferrales bacterium]
MAFDSSRKQATRWLGGIFLAVGLVFLGVGGWFAEKRFTVIRSWPQVQAEVVESEVISYDDAEGDTLYKAAFRFRYTVAGREYLTRTDNGYGTSFRSWMQKKVDHLPPGARHSIHYNPAAPTEIEYNAGYNFEFFGISLFCGGMGLIFALVGARAIGVMGMPRRTRSDAHRCPACSQYIAPGQVSCPNCDAPLPST